MRSVSVIFLLVARDSGSVAALGSLEEVVFGLLQY